MNNLGTFLSGGKTKAEKHGSSELQLRQQLQDGFSAMGINPASGTISGPGLVDWAQRSGIACEKKTLRKLCAQPMRWDKLSLDNSVLILEKYFATVDQSHRVEAQENVSEALSASAATQQQVVQLGLVGYLLYHCGLKSRRLIFAESTGRKEGDVSEEQLSSVIFQLDVSCARFGPQATFYTSAITAFLLLATCVLICLLIFWTKSMKERRQARSDLTSKSINLFAVEYIKQHFHDRATEMQDDAGTMSDWISYKWVLLRKEMEERLTLEVGKLAAGIGHLAAVASSLLLKGMEEEHVAIAALGNSRDCQLSADRLLVLAKRFQVAHIPTLPGCPVELRPRVSCGAALTSSAGDVIWSAPGAKQCLNAWRWNVAATGAVAPQLVANMSDGNLKTFLSVAALASEIHAAQWVVLITLFKNMGNLMVCSEISGESFRHLQLYSLVCASNRLNSEQRAVTFQPNDIPLFDLSSQRPTRDTLSSFDGVPFPEIHQHITREVGILSPVVSPFTLTNASLENWFYASTCTTKGLKLINYVARSEGFGGCEEMSEWENATSIGEREWFGRRAFTITRPVGTTNTLILLAVSVDEVLSVFRLVIARATDHLNKGMSKETTLALRREEFLKLPSVVVEDLKNVNVGSRFGHNLAQITHFASPGSCIGVCQRTREGVVALSNAFNSQHPGWIGSYNYFPVPVVAAYAYVGLGVDMVVLVERKVERLHRMGLSTLLTLLNEHNAKFAARGVEIAIAHIAGLPFAPFFDSAERCAKGALCVEAFDSNGTSQGIVMRDDCLLCSRVLRDSSSIFQLEYLTELHASSSSLTPISDELSAQVLQFLQSTGARSLHFNSIVNWQNKVVSAEIFLLAALNSALVVTLDSSSDQDDFSLNLWLLSLITAACVGTGMLGFILTAHFVMKRMKMASSVTQEQLLHTAAQMNHFIDGIVPPFVEAQLLGGSKSISRFHKDSAIASIDVAGFTDFIRGWHPKDIVRFSSYLNFLYEVVSNHFHVVKLNRYGDAVVCVAGLEYNYLGKGSPSSKHVFVLQCAKFGAIVLQLFSAKYRHHPEKAGSGPKLYDSKELLEDEAALLDFQPEKKNKQICRTMPDIRMGMHFGVLFSGCLSGTLAPRFDCYGTSMFLAHRMQVTAPKNRIHVSVQFKDILHSVDHQDIFEFEPPRKTVVTAHSMMSSYLVFSVHLPMPGEIMKTLGVEYAQSTYIFDQVAAAQQSDDPTSSNSKSLLSHTISADRHSSSQNSTSHTSATTSSDTS